MGTTKTRKISTGVHTQAAPSSCEGRFDDMPEAAQRTLAATLALRVPLFRVDCGDLFATYLAAFPESQRQHHNCHACRSFLHRYGSLATIGGNGKLMSALWDEAELPQDSACRPVVKALRLAVERGKVCDVFLWTEALWGTPEAGGWTHFAVRPGTIAHTRRDVTAGQAMAEKREDRKHLALALADMTLPVLRQAHAMLGAGSLHRPEKLTPMCDFLIDTHEAVVSKSGEARNRALWSAVGKAPAGWCTPRGSALGMLVEDIAAGKSAETIARRHNEKMEPDKYQRPSAPPPAGNVRQAEALFEKMGLAAALRRRPAMASEVQTIWRPTDRKPTQGKGLFGHLLTPPPQGNARLTTTPTAMTFARFRRDVLPTALDMAVLVPAHGNFCAMTTACDPDAPPILQWDREDKRNPVAWYVYVSGSPASQWSLCGGVYVPVVGLSLQPTLWGDESRNGHQGASALFILRNCADTRHAGLALFPECIRSELHAVRSTIEAHSRSRNLDDPGPGQRASGLRMMDGAPVMVRVATAAGVAEYRLDRWE